MKTNKSFKVSIVVPIYNEENNVEHLLKSIDGSMAKYNYEIILVDDGSTDKTAEIIKKASKRNSNVHYMSFSRNFGHQAALRAGLLCANGDAVISMDGDMQHPPRLLPKLINKWLEGYEIVNTLRDDSDAVLTKKLSSRLFYSLINRLGNLQIENGSADFRLLDKKVVEVINSQSESGLFLRGYVHWIGFKQTSFEYKPDKRRSGKTKYSPRKMIAFAASGITQFSIKPLRIAFGFAFFSFVVAVAYSVYAIWIGLFTTDAVKGWTSLVVLFVFLEGLQFLLIGLLGEYVGRTFMQTKGRPEFIIRETDLNR